MDAVNDGLWGVREAAQFLGICETTLRKLSVRTGELPYARIGRKLKFQRSALQAWLDSQTRVTTDQTDRV